MSTPEDNIQRSVEEEINKWSGFERALRTEDREAFCQLMEACKAYVREIGLSGNQFLFEPVVMSILIFQHKRVTKLERILEEAKKALVARGLEANKS